VTDITRIQVRDVNKDLRHKAKTKATDTIGKVKAPKKKFSRPRTQQTRPRLRPRTQQGQDQNFEK